MYPAAEARFLCHAHSALSSRLCPCVDRDPLAEQREQLRMVIAREQEMQRHEVRY